MVMRILWKVELVDGVPFASAEVTSQLSDQAITFLAGAVLDRLVVGMSASPGHRIESFMVEVNVDTGRIICALGSTDTTPVAACSVRVQSLQDVWCDLDNEEVSGVEFSGKIDEIRSRIGGLFESAARQRFLGHTQCSSGLDFVLFGAEPGVAVRRTSLF